MSTDIALVPKRRRQAGPALVLDPQDPATSARKFIALRKSAKDGVRTLHRWRDEFFDYAGSHYRGISSSATRAELWKFLEGARCSDGPFKPTSHRVANVLDALSGFTMLDAHLEQPLWLDGADLDAPPACKFLAVKNGLLHLPSRELWPQSPAMFTTNASDVTYDAEAPEPSAWLQFLCELFGEDADAVQLLKEWFGYCLTPDTSQQKILLIVGPPRSGKGTIARVLKALLGRGSVVAPTLSSLGSNFGLAPLIGSRLAIIADVRLDGKTDRAVISERLLSISGEDAITVDRKHREAWTGQLQTRFMLMTNELPEFPDASTALAKRFAVLQLTNSFYGREDPGLLEKLIAEMPGILNWAVDGHAEMRRRGHFTQPASSHDTIASLEALASPILTFVDERCVLGTSEAFFVETDALYAGYRAWCPGAGIKNVPTKERFGRDLKAALQGKIHPTRAPRDANGHRSPGYAGLLLLPAGNDTSLL